MQYVLRMTLELETMVVSGGLFTDLLSKAVSRRVVRKMKDGEIGVMAVDCDTHVFGGGAQEFEKKLVEFIVDFVSA